MPASNERAYKIILIKLLTRTRIKMVQTIPAAIKKS